MAMPIEESSQASGDSTASTQFAPFSPRRYRDFKESHFEYRMKHQSRGKAIIINNEKFDCGMGDVRTGSSVDRDNLVKSLRFIGFKSEHIIVKDNLNGESMVKLLTDVAEEDHTNRDCLFVAILSHGDEAHVCGTDRPVHYDLLLKPIRESPSLGGKPKIFVVQACRGKTPDDGVQIQHDAVPTQVKPETYFIAKESDILFALSAVPGYLSWRIPDTGSWFIQTLSEVILRDGKRLEFVRLLTRVNYLVSYNFISKVKDADLTNKKQSPCIVSMLTKDLYFA